MREGLLYAGTERGVYVSFDDGDALAAAADEPAGDLGARPRGQGRRSRDRHARPRLLDPRRRVAAAAGGRDGAGRDAGCSRPRRAVRLRHGRVRRHAVPEGRAGRARTRRTARTSTTCSALPRRSRSRSSIRDAAGAEVRRYSSADAAARGRSSPGSASRPEWQRTPVRARGDAGAATASCGRSATRRAAALAHAARSADGVWAPPGRYWWNCTVDGRTLTQPLEVRPDPARRRSRRGLRRAVRAGAANRGRARARRGRRRRRHAPSRPR